MRTKAMSTGRQPSLIDDLTAFTTRLDGLHVDQNPDDLSDALRTAFKQRELYDSYVSSLVGDIGRAMALLEVFDKALQATTYDVTIFKRFRQLCGRTGLLPTSHTIPERLIQTTEHPVASGGFGDVWEGIYDDKRVAIKALRVYKRDGVQRVKKAFCKEVAMWKQISHPNIVPFLGVSGAPAPLSMVSEWMPNGSVRDYVRANPESSRLQLLLDISRGLSFLHSLEIVHGDLKGDNILIDKSGRACLGDFGFTSIASLNCTETSAPGFKGSNRWMAPELFGIEETSGLSTRESDIFALGMVTFEVFTGQVPFPEYKSSAMVMASIITGKRPSRPPKGRDLGLSDELWGVIQSSLTHEVEKRPSASTFVHSLEKATPDIAALKGLTEFDASSQGHIQKLRHVFEYGDNTLLGMREKETLTVIEVFDRALNSSLNDSTLRSRCLHGLQKVSARCGLLPKSYWISHSSLAEPRDASSATGNASSTRRLLMDGKLVAVKTISADRIENPDAFKCRLCTNAILWKQLRHPNVVSFLGFGSSSPPMSLVYPWIPNGSLSSYVREHPDADKLRLLLGVAQGLTYLHRHNLVHGSLTGRNILVDSDGVACISEYGLETVLPDKASSKPITADVRWMAPEVLNTKDRCIPSGDDGKAADVYSFAMIMFEVLSGTIPFPGERDEDIVDRVAMGVRPGPPPDNPSKWSVGDLWEQIEACWNQEPNERPTASKVLQILQGLGESKHQESVVSVENFGNKAMVRKQECVNDDPREMPPTHEEHKEHHDSDNPSCGTRTSPSPLSGSMPSQSSFLHLPRHVTATTETTKRREPVVEKPTSRTEIIDQRDEEVVVCDDRIPYVMSRPIPEGKTLKEVVITTVSKDQGWSNHIYDYGTYRNSWTWFELSVASPPKGPGEKWRGLVVRNLHAHGDFKEHTIMISDGKLYEKARGGDVLTVWAVAKFSGWRNTVKKVTIRYVVE